MRRMRDPPQRMREAGHSSGAVSNLCGRNLRRAPALHMALPSGLGGKRRQILWFTAVAKQRHGPPMRPGCKVRFIDVLEHKIGDNRSGSGGPLFNWDFQPRTDSTDGLCAWTQGIKSHAHVDAQPKRLAHHLHVPPVFLTIFPTSLRLHATG